MVAQLPERSGAADIVAKAQQDLGLQLSRSTVTRIVRRKGLQRLSPKVVPLLTARQRVGRVKFAKAALRR